MPDYTLSSGNFVFEMVKFKTCFCILVIPKFNIFGYKCSLNSKFKTQRKEKIRTNYVLPAVLNL